MRNAVVTPRPSLFILRALGLGDFLTAVPALRALARAFPGHYRMLAAPLYLAPLARMCGAIDEVIEAAPLAPIDARLPAPDIAVNLHGRGPESHRVTLRLRPKRLIAFAHSDIIETIDAPEWRAEEHEIDRWCRLLRESGIPADSNDLEVQAPSGDARTRGAIIIHPGAATESRRWPVSRWIELCRDLRSEGHRLVLTGSAREFRRCRVIAKASDISLDDVIAGQTDLEDLACAIASSRAIVCGDTGVAHVATALRTPSIVLFGPTSPRYWGPPANRPYHRVIWRGTLGDPHAPFVDPGLASITAREVAQQLRELLYLARAG